MTETEHIDYWLSSASHDLETLDALFIAGKYDWALFMGHLVLEKVIKAVYVIRSSGRIPPKLHNLVRLAEAADIVLDEEQKNKTGQD